MLHGPQTANRDPWSSKNQDITASKSEHPGGAPSFTFPRETG